jgi:hypothetical protein
MNAAGNGIHVHPSTEVLQFPSLFTCAVIMWRQKRIIAIRSRTYRLCRLWFVLASMWFSPSSRPSVIIQTSLTFPKFSPPGLSCFTAAISLVLIVTVELPEAAELLRRGGSMFCTVLREGIPSLTYRGLVACLRTFWLKVLSRTEAAVPTTRWRTRGLAALIQDQLVNLLTGNNLPSISLAGWFSLFCSMQSSFRGTNRPR